MNFGHPGVTASVDWNTIQKVVQGVTAAVKHESANALSGKIFEVLQAAHPDSSDARLNEAIQTAIDFERACCRNFEYTQGGSLGQDADRAVEIAKVAYPHFQESTYRHASFALAVAML